LIKVGAPHRLSGVSIGGQRAPVGSIGGDRGSTPPDDPRSFHGLDRGKKSIAIHLGDPRGRDLYLKLVEQSDVVL
ncbi:MAG: CoA transferase, partial [Chloroflexi bacterium]|nr:CoA transferase [Chloroflexota bacterium]